MRLRVLHWNVWWKENIHRAIEFIKTVDADVLCLQEVTDGCEMNGKADNAALIAATGYDYHLVSAHKFPEGHTQGNGVFSKLPIIERSEFWVQKASTNQQGYAHEGRVCTLAKIDVQGKVLEFGTTHLSYTHRFEITEKKKAEIDKLLSLLNQKRKSFIFTGDLNTSPEQETIPKISEILPHCGPEYTVPTWTTKPFEYNGFFEDKLRWRLDYVFATPDLRVRSAKTLSTTVSDHLPILVEFDI
ncbi:MAG TPA: endonuclease/exonuclease/phosphatase family protein [Candidatus Nanoarchaeia archaeon]|nr:endonuclease/exonuclease/phosphatase family protein [Candidatus Nanoarchaeia archaeon]